MTSNSQASGRKKTQKSKLHSHTRIVGNSAHCMAILCLKINLGLYYCTLYVVPSVSVGSLRGATGLMMVVAVSVAVVATVRVLQ